MAGAGICVLCLTDTCASEVHPVFNPVPPYGYLLPNMYLFIADITNPDLFDVMGCSRTWIRLDTCSTCTSRYFVRSRASHPAGPVNRGGKV